MKRRTFLAVGAMLALSACTGSAKAASSVTAASASAVETEALTASAVGSASAAVPEVGAGKSLMLYFSATGNTAKLAQEIIAQTGADSFEIIPAEPYTGADLNYHDDSCRANREQNDDSARPAISGGIENFDEYDTVYLGFPIWWGTIPRIINTLLDTCDFSDKVIMPFCTSGGSGISAAVDAIRAAEPDADVKDGLRLSGSAAANCADEVTGWIEENK